MHIKVIENDGEFLSLKDDWNKLTQGLITTNRFDWMYRWWQYFKKNNALKILVAEENNIVLGIAPLYIKNMRILKYLTIKKLCFLGDEISLYLDFLIPLNQNRESVFQALLNYILNNLPFDVLGLNDINSHYPNFDLWQKYASLQNLKLEASYKCPKIRLFEYRSYKDYFDQLSRKEKLSLKAGQNKIKKNNVHIEYIFKNDIKEEDIKIVSNIHIKRQQYLYEKGAHGRFSHFTDEQKTNFIKDYFCLGEPDSKMIVYMKCNGTVISYILVLINKNTLFHWNSAFNSSYKIYTPTKLLTHELIKYAFENNYEYLDLGRGSDSYKMRWSNDISMNYNLKKFKSFKAKLVYFCKNNVPEFLIPGKFRFKNIKTSLTSSH